MPTYTFTLPYAASAETITIADEVSGAVVDTIAPAAASGAVSYLVREGSEVVITATLDVGEYVATAVDTETWSSTRFSTEGVLDVPASLQASDPSGLVQAVDLAGAKIPGYRARIVFDAAGEPDDIVLVAI